MLDMTSVSVCIGVGDRGVGGGGGERGGGREVSPGAMKVEEQLSNTRDAMPEEIKGRE